MSRVPARSPYARIGCLLVATCCLLISGTSSSSEPASWDSLMATANSLLERGLFSDALAAYKAALAQAERKSDPVKLAATLTCVGAAYTELGLLTEAEQSQRRALGLVPSDHRLYPTIVNNLADVVHLTGNSTAARSLYREAWSAWAKTLGKNEGKAGVAMMNIAATYVSEGRLDEAMALYARSARVLEKVAGPNHRKTLAASSGYAVTLTARGEYSRAEKLEHDLLVRHETSLGQGDSDTISLLISLAGVHSLQRKAECVALYERAVSDASEFLGLTHPLTVTAWSGLAGCLIGQRRPKEAVRAAEHAIRICETSLDTRCNAMRAAALRNLADAHAANGNHQEAELAYVRALDIVAVTCHACNLHVMTLMQYAKLLRKLDRRADLRNVEDRLKGIRDSRPSGNLIVDLHDLDRR